MGTPPCAMNPSPHRRLPLPVPVGTEGGFAGGTELHRPQPRTDAASWSCTSSPRLLCQKPPAQVFESPNLSAVYCPSVTNKLLNAVHQQASSLC